jgi:hypothetical protein
MDTRNKWECPMCDEIVQAWNVDIFKLRIDMHCSREHKMNTPQMQNFLATRNAEQIVNGGVTNEDIKWLKEQLLVIW